MYESVDDEVLDKFSVDSLEYPCLETSPEPLKPPTVVDETPTRSSVPFRLHEKSHAMHIIPFNSAPDKGKPSWNCEIDETVLMSKGLQLNEDGSFSKSPRDEDFHDLPFIMAAPRIALIRRKKQDMKKSSEEILRKGTEATRATLVSNRRRTNSLPNGELSRLKASGNLTDSMKEALCKKYMARMTESELPNVENLLANFKKDLRMEGKQKSEELVRLSKATKKNRSDLQLPTIEKPMKLSYFERYQKKNGFDPMSISLKGQKPVGETVRSKFGDSSRDTLSEVSSRFTTVNEDEEEELFYQKIMAEEGFKVGNSESDFSERSFGEKRADKAFERKKEVKLMKTNSNKMVKKSSQGTPNESIPHLRSLGCKSSGRKSGHCCAIDQEPLPKAELAFKARAYGNLANTRNIVKMQLKSYRRDWESPAAAKGESFLPPLKDARFSPGGRRGIL